MQLHQDLRDRWQDGLQIFAVQEKAGTLEIDLILKRYSGAGRHYHTNDHLRFLFKEYDRHSALITDKPRIFFAIWYHDLIYKTWRKDNELVSANHAARALEKFGLPKDSISNIHRLIVATASHDDPKTDDNDRLFLDMDMAVLGFPSAQYDHYVKDIRKEYRLIPKPMFNKGRKAFLEKTLSKPRVFLTDLYEDEMGENARENITRELEALG